MFLGLDAERPFRVCSSLRKVAIKDTSVTDLGAFSLMIHCDNLEILEFSQEWTSNIKGRFHIDILTSTLDRLLARPFVLLAGPGQFSAAAALADTAELPAN